MGVDDARTVLTPLVDSVQALNVLVALVLEGGPVDLGSVVWDLVAVSVGLVQLLPVKRRLNLVSPQGLARK